MFSMGHRPDADYWEINGRDVAVVASLWMALLIFASTHEILSIFNGRITMSFDFVAMVLTIYVLSKASYWIGSFIINPPDIA